MDAKSWADIITKILSLGLLTAIGAFFVRWFRRRRMRQQLYHEISSNYQNTVVRIHLVTSLTGLRQAAPLHFNDNLDISFNVWSFYNDEKQREMLFGLKEAGAISRIYEKLSLIGNEKLPGYVHVRGKEALAEIDDRLLDGTLDKKLYKKESSVDAWHYMDDLLTGKRKSYRTELNPI